MVVVVLVVFEVVVVVFEVVVVLVVAIFCYFLVEALVSTLLDSNLERYK